MRSMTGFGRAETERNNKKVTIEIKSVNHRFLDINIRLPRTLMFLEEEVRNIIKSRVSRGRLEVFINYYSCGENEKNVIADISYIKAYLNALNSVKKQTGLKNDLKLSHIIKIPDAITVEELQKDEQELKSIVLEAAFAALDLLIAMRDKEGGSLKSDIIPRLKTLENTASVIQAKEGIVVEEYREKLKKRLAELISGTELDENRFNAEVVYFADRQNITEEVVRLKTHIKAFESLVSNGEPKGRQFDFIVQEMLRELNTIGSKTSDMDIIKAVLTGKSELEKIREQVQNIE